MAFPLKKIDQKVRYEEVVKVKVKIVGLVVDLNAVAADLSVVVVDLSVAAVDLSEVVADFSVVAVDSGVEVLEVNEVESKEAEVNEDISRNKAEFLYPDLFHHHSANQICLKQRLNLHPVTDLLVEGHPKYVKVTKVHSIDPSLLCETKSQ